MGLGTDLNEIEMNVDKLKSRYPGGGSVFISLKTVKRRCMNIIPEFIDAFEKLGWDPEDDIALEIGGTSVYEIEGAGTKWAPVKGTRKYNKDAFIVIKTAHEIQLSPLLTMTQNTPTYSKVEASEQQSDSGEPANEHMEAIDEDGIEPKPSTTQEKEPDDTSLNPTLPKNPICRV